MAVSTKLGKRYAKSLLELAEEMGQLEEVKGDMETVSKVMQDSPEFRTLLKSPIINSDKKKAIFHEVFAGNISELSLNFIDIITRKGRESELDSITRGFMELYRAHKGISKAVVTTAIELSEEQRADIKARLAEATGQKIDIEEVVDPSIIGGMTLTVGDRRYNGSIAHQLNLMKRQFKKNLYVADY